MNIIKTLCLISVSFFMLFVFVNRVVIPQDNLMGAMICAFIVIVSPVIVFQLIRKWLT